MDNDIEKIIKLIQATDLDQTIKEILIRDLQAEGLTDFLREQIKAYCSDALKKLEEKKAEVEKILSQKQKDPSV